MCIVLLAALYSRTRLGAIDRAERSATPLHVAVIQPNHTIERRRELRRQGDDAFARDMVSQSRHVLDAVAAAGGRIDVLVWPEGALREDPAQQQNRAVLELAREAGAEIWTGASHHETGAGGSTVSHNSAFRILANGAIDRRYDKNVLVPFGEYVPLRGVVPGFDRIPAVANFEHGKEVPTYVSGTARFVFLICYEAIHAAFVRAVAGDDVNLLVNVTVDAWYGDTSEQSQHLMLAATQSAMNGVPLIRATSTGISAIVDARGSIVARTRVFARDAIIAEVRPLRIPGPYSRRGEWFAWCCVGVSMSLLLWPRARRGREGEGRPAR
jgi:apolipoprotein N-acyltransferase